MSAANANKGSKDPRRRSRGRPPDPDQRTAKHARMMHVAFKLFSEQSYDQVTVERIAHKAGQSKGAFYWYFKGKEDCLRQILIKQGQKLQQDMAKAMGAHARASQRLLGISDFHNWSSPAFFRFVRLLNNVSLSRTASVRELGHELQAQWIDNARELIVGLSKDAARESGWSREEIAAFDFETWVSCYLACYEGIYYGDQRDLVRQPLDVERVAEAIHRAFIHPLLRKPNARPAGSK